MSVLVPAQPRSPMTTDIVETTHGAALIPNNDQRFVGNFLNEVISRLRDLTLVSDQHPFLRENLFLFLGKNSRRNKIFLFERFRSGCESFSGFAKGRCCGRLHQTEMIQIRKVGNKEGPVECALGYITNSISYVPAFLIPSLVLDSWLRD